MAKKWKNHLIQQKLQFLKMYSQGFRSHVISKKLGMDRKRALEWCYTINLFGKDRFLSMGKTKSQYPYEIKVAAVKAYIERNLTYVRVMQCYQIVSAVALKSWIHTYRKDGLEALKPKPKGRPSIAKTKVLTREQRLEREIQYLRAENALLKKVAVLKD